MNQLQKDKEAFFAQYWGQKVACTDTFPMYGDASVLLKSEPDKADSDYYLLLKSLDNIIDDDAKVIAKIVTSWDEECPLSHEDVPEWLDEVFPNNAATYADYVSGYQMLQIIDFLRSEGYLMPFRNYTVEQIVEMGWAKIED